MSTNMKTPKVLFHEALEALSLHVGDKTITEAGYTLKHLGNALVVAVDGGWVSIRSGIDMYAFNQIIHAIKVDVLDTMGMYYALAGHIERTNMTISYKANGDTSESFVWANNNMVFIGGLNKETRLITELSPMDFFELMEQAGVCLVGHYNGPTGKVGEYEIVSK